MLALSGGKPLELGSGILGQLSGRNVPSAGSLDGGEWDDFGDDADGADAGVADVDAD